MKFALIGAAAIATAASNSRASASRYRTPRLLRAVLPECKLSKPWDPAIRKLMAATIPTTCTGITATKRHLVLEGRPLRPHVRPKREPLVGSSIEWQMRSTHKREWFMFTPVEAGC